MSILVKNKLVIQGENTFEPIPAETYSQPIQLKPALLFPMSFIYAASEVDGTPLTAENIVDISTVNNINGAPTGVPANEGLAIVQWGYYQQPWYNVLDYKLHIDLDGVYDLDYAYVWVPQEDNQYLTVYSSINGTDLTVISNGRVSDLNKDSWVKIDFQGPARGGAKYIVLGFGYAQSYLKGFVLYGRPKGGVNINKGIKQRRNIPIRSLDRILGSNAFYFEDPELMGPVSGITRWYVLPDWVYGSRFRNTGSAYGHTVDDLDLRFDNSHMGSLDQQLQGFKNTSTNSMFTFTQSPVAFRPVGTANASSSKPINPGFSTVNLAHTTVPANYSFISRIFWNIAARYGANTAVDRTYIQLDQYVPQPERVGLGLMECIEAGNEYDAWWNGAQGYFNPEEMAAYMSASYDGDLGRMGPGMGVKQADPSMKMAMVAVALSDNYTYVRRMIWWWDKHRGKGNYPIDIINFHYYNSSGGSQLENDGSGIHGLQPEKGEFLKVCRAWSTMRNTYLPSGEVWLTETGYDENLGGPYSPAKVTQFERSRCKAYWIGRLFIVGQIGGIDVIQHYWFANQGGIRFTDQPEDEPNTGPFASSGLVDGVQDASDFNRFPLMSYWYVAQFRAALTGYTFQHAIMMDGVSNIEENIIGGNTSTVWAAAYKNYITDECIVAIWLSSSDFLTANVTVQVPENAVDVTTIDEAEIRKGLVGVTTSKVAANGHITMVVNECVQFIKTSNIGTELLIQPKNIRTQIVKSTATLITWEDDNTGDVSVLVSRSQTLNGVYTPIFQGVRNGASYVDTNTGGNSYYYKVAAVRGDIDIPPVDPPVDPPVFDNNLNAEELTAGSVYYAPHAKKFVAGTDHNAVEAVHGDSVGRFTDLKGLHDLIYIGENQPPVIGVTEVGQKLGVPPKLFTTGEQIGMVEFPNVPYIPYQTLDFAGSPEATTWPHAFMLTIMSRDGQGFEDWIGAGENRHMIANNGNGIRIGGAGEDAFFPEGVNSPEHYKIESLFVEFTNEWTTFTKSGVPQGRIVNQANDDGNHALIKTKNMIGTTTNSAPFNFIAMHVWYGPQYEALQANKQAIINSINTKFLVNTVLDKPHVINGTISLTNGTWTPSFTPVNATAGQIASAQYRWFLYLQNLGGDSSGNFANQVLISKNPVLHESEYTSYPEKVNALTCYVWIGGQWDKLPTAFGL